jgi:RNA polymerase sigma factor (TIGR02999 family)
MRDDRAIEALAAALYPEMRAIAGKLGRRFATSETLRQTALVSEAFLRLRQAPGFADEAHFLRTAALAMRQIIVNHARARVAAKRGGGAATVEFDDDLPVFWDSDERLLALEDALQRLEKLDPRLAQVVDCRFFGGFDEVETARALGVSDRTVRRDWIKARAILRTELDSL